MGVRWEIGVQYQVDTINFLCPLHELLHGIVALCKPSKEISFAERSARALHGFL